jgi:hypothetical protein
MAGGGGKPQNIFKLNRGNDPKEVLNWRLWFAVSYLRNEYCILIFTMG